MAFLRAEKDLIFINIFLIRKKLIIEVKIYNFDGTYMLFPIEGLGFGEQNMRDSILASSKLNSIPF